MTNKTCNAQRGIVSEASQFRCDSSWTWPLATLDSRGICFPRNANDRSIARRCRVESRETDCVHFCYGLCASWRSDVSLSVLSQSTQKWSQRGHLHNNNIENLFEVCLRQDIAIGYLICFSRVVLVSLVLVSFSFPSSSSSSSSSPLFFKLSTFHG